MSTSPLGQRTGKSSHPQTPSACPYLPLPLYPPPASSISFSKTSQIISSLPECSLCVCPAPVPTLSLHSLCPGHAQSPSSYEVPRRWWVNARDWRFLESISSSGTEYGNSFEAPFTWALLPPEQGPASGTTPSSPPDPDCSAGVHSLFPVLLAHGPLPGSCLLFHPLPLVLTIIPLALLATSSLIQGSPTPRLQTGIGPWPVRNGPPGRR